MAFGLREVAMIVLFSSQLDYQFGVGGCKAPELPWPFLFPGLSLEEISEYMEGDEKWTQMFVVQKAALA